MITDFIEYNEELTEKFAKENDLTLHEFNERITLSTEFEKGSYMLFYDKQTQIELYSKKYNLNELIKIVESLIGQN